MFDYSMDIVSKSICCNCSNLLLTHRPTLPRMIVMGLTATSCESEAATFEGLAEVPWRCVSDSPIPRREKPC